MLQKLRWLLPLALLYPTVFTLVYFVALEKLPALTQQLVYSGGKVIQFVVLPLLCWQAIPAREKTWPRCSPRALLLGIGSGLVIGAVIVWPAVSWLIPSGFFADAARTMQAKLLGFGLDTPAKFAGLAIFYSVVHSGLEEFYWRWFVDRRLRSLVGPAWSLVLSSVGFALHHVVVIAVYLGWTNPLTYLASAAVGIGGAWWAWCDRRCGSITPSWVSHALVDAALFYVGWQLVGQSMSHAL
jgi:uncharacterized protein